MRQPSLEPIPRTAAYSAAPIGAPGWVVCGRLLESWRELGGGENGFNHLRPRLGKHALAAEPPMGDNQGDGRPEPSLTVEHSHLAHFLPQRPIRALKSTGRAHAGR